MNHTDSIIWFTKATAVCSLILAFCWLTPRLVNGIPDFPSITADEAQNEVVDHYLKLPVTDVALTGSSYTIRLREEYFQRLSLRNLALLGGSPLTGAAVIASASVRPRFVAIETNVLSRPVDQALVEKFRSGGRHLASLPVVRPLRTLAALYQRKVNDLKRLDTEDPVAMLRERNREEALLRAPPASTHAEIPIAITLAEWNKPNNDSAILSGAADMKRLVDKLEAEGVVVFFYELAIDPALEEARYMKTGRLALEKFFGPDNHRRLLLKYPTNEIRWADGSHLDERSAIIMARSLERAIEERMHAIDNTVPGTR